MKTSYDEDTKAYAANFDYDAHGYGYALQRRADPKIAAFIHQSLGTACTVLNVGAGAGSYEPVDRYVIAVEPSATMRAQRPTNLSPAINGSAESLPIDDKSVDASMAILTVHHWSNLSKGLSELNRVTRGPILVMTFDMEIFSHYWLADYAPELVDIDRRRFPAIGTICKSLNRSTEVSSIPILINCTHGFAEAHYAYPERFLDPAVRHSQSMWGLVEEKVTERFVKSLSEDLSSGAWDKSMDIYDNNHFMKVLCV